MTDFEQRMARLIGKRTLVGITYVEPDGERRIQMHGVISRRVENVGSICGAEARSFCCRRTRTPFIQQSRADTRERRPAK